MTYIRALDRPARIENQTGLKTREKPMSEAKPKPYMQNRELSWLTFNQRVLDQGTDETVPPLEQLKFAAIFSSNLQEFFMVRVGSLTDLTLIKKPIRDNKTLMTPQEQLDEIYKRSHELYPLHESIFETISAKLEKESITRITPETINDEQRKYLIAYAAKNITPFLSPQVINVRHPFPHLENGSLYLVVRLGDPASENTEGVLENDQPKKGSTSAKKTKNMGARGVTLGIIPLPRQCERIIKLPGEGFSFILLEHALECLAGEVFSMYSLKRINIICVTRNADLDTVEGLDEADEDYREHMKRILKRRTRLTPVRLESDRPLSQTVSAFLLKQLRLESHQVFVTKVPLDMSYVYDLVDRLPKPTRDQLSYTPFQPQWAAMLDRNRPVIDQIAEKEVVLSYPYESIDPFVQLLKEAAVDPSVISIKITLYRLANHSQIAEALSQAAENGKEVTALVELRARFDEKNNIEWSARFEEAGVHVIYGFKNYKVHSKICLITRQTPKGLQHITQLGTGNYNEKTARLYTDLAFFTSDAGIGRDAVEFFRNVGLENVSDNYDLLWVAPLQIKPMILAKIDEQIALSRQGEPCELFFKTNSITDKDIIEKIVEASQAGVPVTLFVRGISCLVPDIKKYTKRVRVISIVGRLLEHSRIYGFGPRDNVQLYLSSADLMTRNMDKRVEIAWPILNNSAKEDILEYLDVSLRDTAKMRELLPDKSYTPLGALARSDSSGKPVLFDSQEYLIKLAQEKRAKAAQEEVVRAQTTEKASQEPREKQKVDLLEKMSLIDKFKTFFTRTFKR